MGKAIELIGAAQASELRTALRECSDEIADVVLSELEDIAAGVAEDARARVPHRSGAARASYKARGTAVVFGDGVPYVPWLEFGGSVGRKGPDGRGTVKRPMVKGGRYVYPAINASLADIEKRVDDLISQITGGYLEVE
jgi:hypothetical protein